MRNGCPDRESTSYAAFSLRLHERVVRSRVPVEGSIELTARCNLNCVHCYINRPADDSHARAGELSTNQWKRIIDQAADEGCLWMLITGGEPLIRPDFPRIYRHAKTRGMIITIFTNGTAVKPSTAGLLAKWPPFAVEISLYGATRDTYERVTRVPGSFDRCLRGIELLRARGVRLRLKSMVLTLNRHEVEDMKKLALSLGAEFRFDPVVNPRLDGDATPLCYRLPAPQIIELDMADEERVAQWYRYHTEHAAPLPHPEQLYQCGAGVSSFHVDPNGCLGMCVMARAPHYDLAAGSFETGWREAILAERNRRRVRSTKCTNCSLMAICGLCPGSSEIESGDPELPVDFLCRIAHLRAHRLGLTDGKEVSANAPEPSDKQKDLCKTTA